jgi:DNA topoisomerase-1
MIDGFSGRVLAVIQWAASFRSVPYGGRLSRMAVGSIVALMPRHGAAAPCRRISSAIVAEIKGHRPLPNILGVTPIESAKSAGLRYVCDESRGIRRDVGPKGFRYVGPDGKVIRRAADLQRFKRLAIPPAWVDVWICVDPLGHLQATGRDARRRKQYRYHSNWRASRDETKYDRMQAFAAALPAIRKRTETDLARPGLPREKVLSTVVQLLEKSLIRVGNDEYARANRSFGLTTLRRQHVDVQGSTLTFEFRGKSGVRHSVGVNDRRLARIVKQCRDLPGQELFQYVDAEGAQQNVTSSDVNAYVKEITGEDFSAKDFRTWAGTVLAVVALRDVAPAESITQARKNVLQAIETVAGMLGNTRAVCRKSYIHPAVIDAYVDGSMFEMLGRPGGSSTRKGAMGLRDEETMTLLLLQQKTRKAA